MQVKTVKAVGMAIAASGLAMFTVPVSAMDLAEGFHSSAVRAAPVEDVAEHSRDRRYRDYRRSAYRHRDRYDDRYRDYRDPYYNDHYRDPYYDTRYRDPYYGQPVYRNTRVWRGRDGRYYCGREDGTTGLLVGAIAGGLIGNEVAGRRDKGVGTVIGAIGGALIGREIDRSNSRCR